MAQLFSKTTILDRIKIFDDKDLADQIQIVQDLYDDYKKWLTKDETRYEQRFNSQFFGTLLWYEESKNRHPKASTPIWGKIADVGLGFFEDGAYSYEWIRVIVELKWSTAWLDKKQSSYGWQSPVDQWFGYKTSFSQDTRLIVSNFGSIRLYRDNKQDYEIWTLEELASGDNDRYELKKLLLLMQKRYLISTSEESQTQKLLSKFRYDQEHISKKFYQEYKQLRLELINDIRSQNEWISIDMVVEKSQKIIDRVIFIHFCEDTWLLPADKLKEVIEFGEKAMNPTFQTLTNFFEAVNSWSDKLEIPQWYNWWLFHQDNSLDSLKVWDGICRKFIDLWEYDFDGELSVNILGHIFEQSISDLEQLKIDLLGTETQSDQLVETKQSKRKKDGIFYTPEYIVDYIVQNSLMTRLEERENECMSKIGKRKWYKDELEATMAYQAILQNVKVLDPACGSGAFLVKVFDYLYLENKRVGEIVGWLFHDDAIYKSILRNNIYWVDLNAESVEITKLSLWLKSAQKWKKLNNLDANIKCGNSLIDDPAVAGDKAFVWKEEYKNIMESWGFDVVVGNPPYVRPHNIPIVEKKHLWDTYQTIEAKSDLYACFMERSDKLVKIWWYFSFILPQTRLALESFSKLRKHIAETYWICSFDFYDYMVFEQAQVETTTFVLKKVDKKLETTISFNSLKEERISFKKPYNKLIDSKYNYRYLSSAVVDNILDKIETWSTLLDDVIDFKYGLKTWDDKKFLSTSKNSNTFKPLLRRWHFHRYTIEYQWEFVDYRPDAMKSNKKTARPWDRERFEENKILVMDIAKTLMATYDDQSYYVKDALILQSPKFNIDYKYILLLINSKLINYYYVSSCNVLSVSLTAIKWLPIKKISLEKQKPYIEKADQMLALNKEYHEALNQTLSLLQSEYWLEKIPKKLQKFTELDFDTFKKTLKIKNLSLDKKEELMTYFNKKHAALSELKSQMDTLDVEIDEMVFDLYGLTDEEREIVLAG